MGSAVCFDGGVLVRDPLDSVLDGEAVVGVEAGLGRGVRSLGDGCLQLDASGEVSALRVVDWGRLGGFCRAEVQQGQFLGVCVALELLHQALQTEDLVFERAVLFEQRVLAVERAVALRLAALERFPGFSQRALEVLEAALGGQVVGAGSGRVWEGLGLALGVPGFEELGAQVFDLHLEYLLLCDEFDEAGLGRLRFFFGFPGSAGGT